MKSNPLIKKIGDKNRFSVSYETHPNDVLMLDFDPIIKKYNLLGFYILIHWQARPKGLRRWGIYDSSSRQYYSGIGKDLIFLDMCLPRLLEVDEAFIKTVPSAAIYFPDLILRQTIESDAVYIYRP